jgi:hypothetical protein
MNSLSNWKRALSSASPRTRDKAAMEIRSFSEDICSALWRAIKKRANTHTNGILVRTLQWFNCSDRFTDLFHLALHGDYEVQCHALKILQEQSFDVTQEQLRNARLSLNTLRPRKNLAAKELKLLRRELRGVLNRLTANQ